MLVERLLNDSGDDLDQLPVVQHCLMRLWDRAGADAAKPAASDQSGAGERRRSRPPRHLTLEHYQAIGAIRAHCRNMPKKYLPACRGWSWRSSRCSAPRGNRSGGPRDPPRGPSAQLLDETGVPEEQLRKVVDRLRTDDCSFLVPPRSSVPELPPTPASMSATKRCCAAGDASAGIPPSLPVPPRPPGGPVGCAEKTPMAVFTARCSPCSTVKQRPDNPAADQVETRWKWWTSRPHTEAWSPRYGGGHPGEEAFREELDRPRVGA